MKRLVRWLKKVLFWRQPLPPLPTPDSDTKKDLEKERRKHLEEQERLYRLEYMYLQQKSIGRQGREAKEDG